MSNQIEESDPVPAYISVDVAVRDDGTIIDPETVAPFFAAIRAGDVDLVTSLLDATPSLAHTPDICTPSRRPLYTATRLTAHLGILPLYAATVAGNPYMVALLAQRGAPIDELSPTGDYYDHKIPILRTPLMAAASMGSLPLVKLLFKDLKADDTVVAPDGVIALRLAVLGKHKEIIALLPSRRRGGWLRFKHSQRKAMRRIRKAGYAIYQVIRFFVWVLPKFFVWDIPKECLPYLKQAIKAIPRIPGAIYRFTKRLAKGLWRGIKRIPRFTGTLAKWLWATIKKIPSFCVDFVKGCWNFITTFSKWLWATIKKIPSFCVDFVKGCWSATKTIARWFWKLITQTIPQLLRSAIEFIGRTLASTGRFLLQLLKDIASFFHTLVTAIITCFKNVTLKDVIHALSIVFVSVPKWVWKTIKEVAVAIKNGTIWTLKQMGDVVHCLVRLIWELLLWIPKKFGQIAVGIGEIGVAGVREVVWWINPKLRISSSSAPGKQ